MFVIDLRNKLVGKYCFSVMNNNDVDTVYIYSHFTQYKDYLCYLKVISEDETYVDEFLIDSEKVIIDDNALRVEWTLGAISTHCKKISIQLEFRESNEEDSKVAQSSIVDIVLGDTLDVSEKCAILYPDILKSLQHQIDELDDGSVASFTMTYISDVLTINLKNAEGESVAELQATIPTSTKVDKVQGKGLSTNDFTDALLNKLNSIAEHAQVNVLEGVQVDGNDLPIDANKKVNIANKVTKTDSADKVYGTDGSGNQTTLPVDNAEGKDGNVARRKKTSGQVSVPTTPVANDDATSKQYVDAFGKTIELTVDPTTYVLTATLKDANGNVLATQTVDLPLESVVVNGSYDAQTQSIILTLQNGSTITIPVAGLISGLVSQTDFNALALRVTTAEGNIITLGNTKVNYSDITISGGFVISITKNGSTYPIAEVVNISATPVVVQSTTDLPSENDGNLYVVLDNGYLYAWSNGWQQLYEYTSDLLTITEVTAGEVIYSYISDKGHSNRPIQVESAVRDGEGNIINETYAKKIGYEPRLSVGSADNINSDRQIDDPEASCPPTTMGITGGEAEIKTGIENFEYMEGKSEKFNQLCENGDFALQSHWANWGSTFTMSDKIAHFTANRSYGCFWNNPFQNTAPSLVGHKVLLIATVKTATQTNKVALGVRNNNDAVSMLTFTELSTSWQTLSAIITWNSYNLEPALNDSRESGWDEVLVKNYMAIDLTAIYGAGNEPTTLDEFKAKYPLDYYAYNAGEILSAKVAKLISRGRQQWNEASLIRCNLNGDYSITPAEDGNRLATDYIDVISNTDYHWHAPCATVTLFYDVNKNLISYASTTADSTFTTPANCSYVRFAFTIANYGSTTYKHDITLSVYFDDGEGYDKYYAYSAQEVTLPNIELRSVPDNANGGFVKDIAYAQGGGKRRVGIVDLGTLNWYNVTETGWVGTDTSTSLIPAKPLGNNIVPNANCSSPKYIVQSADYTYTHDYCICVRPQITIRDPALIGKTPAQVKEYLSGVYVTFELAEETELTENQGWTEQVLVDNYGTLQFVTDPQQVPQVEQPYFIRYTIDLKEFLDGTYTHAQGDPQNLALKEDVEALKEDIERGDVKAGKSETADNLTPYSEDSGTTQTIPFINQGTGCGNGETQVDTGKLALMKNKQGNSKTVNMPVKVTTYIWTVNGVEFNTKQNTGEVHCSGTSTGRSNSDVLQGNLNVVGGHKLLILGTLPTFNVNTTYYATVFSNSQGYISHNAIESPRIVTVPANATLMSFEVVPAQTAGITVDFKCYPKLVDLTQMFGSNDNIPAYLLAHPEAFFNYYQGSLAYNEGTLVNSNATKLKTIGRNVWDEQLTSGYYWEYVNGSMKKTAHAERSCSTNPIKVIPNSSICVYGNASVGSDINLWFTDDSGNLIINTGWHSINQWVVDVPANATKLYFTLSNNINYTGGLTISLYYAGESGYDQYYPYEVLTETDTGNEVLRSAGNARDYKEPNGTIHRLVNKYTFTGDEVCSFNSENETHIRFTITLALPPAKQGYNNQNNIDGGHWLQGNQITGVDSNFNALDIRPTMVIINISKAQFTGTSASQFLTWITGKTINYELEEETTEEGTPYAENVKVDDFGSMMWEGEGFNGVPMGAEIFYPIDYKAEMDTLHNHCDGDITSIVLASDLEASEQARDTVDAQLKNALGGTLRQLLATSQSIDFLNTDFIDLGSLTWQQANGTTHTFYASLPSMKIENDKGNYLSTKYKTVNTAYASDAYGNSVYGNQYSHTEVIVTDSAFTGKTSAQVKAMLKGVLLAYEKVE